MGNEKGRPNSVLLDAPDQSPNTFDIFKSQITIIIPLPLRRIGLGVDGKKDITGRFFLHGKRLA
jgi:hypothetical protein